MKATGSSRAVVALLAMIGIYLSAYFLTSEIFLGRLGADRYRIRIFQSEAHRRMFAPLTFVESLVHPRNCEFSAQIRNHASLPPAE